MEDCKGLENYKEKTKENAKMSLKLEKKVEFGNLNIYGTWTDKKLYPYEMAVVFDGNTLFMRQGKYEIKYEPWSVSSKGDKNEVAPLLKDDWDVLNKIFLKCEALYKNLLKNTTVNDKTAL